MTERDPVTKQLYKTVRPKNQEVKNTLAELAAIAQEDGIMGDEDTGTSDLPKFTNEHLKEMTHGPGISLPDDVVEDLESLKDQEATAKPKAKRTKKKSTTSDKTDKS